MYRFALDAPIPGELRRIAAEEVAIAFEALAGPDVDAAVHESRKTCKRVRALLRLVRASSGALYEQENAHFRLIAARLAGARDTAALLEAVDLLTGADPDRLDAIRQQLTAARHATTTVPEQAMVAATVTAFEAAAARMPTWDVPDTGFDALAGGLVRHHRLARRAMTAARTTPTAAALHEWRKRVKDHRYHVELLTAADPRRLREREESLHRLTTLLGQDHDLVGLRGALDATSGPLPAIHQRQVALQFEAFALGDELFAESPGHFAERLRRRWERRVAAM
jgi:CHAD domain-containing protein